MLTLTKDLLDSARAPNFGAVLQVREIQGPKDMEAAFEIRRIVFVIEQNVDPAEEYDEFEGACVHYLATLDALPVGTCRIRKTEKGVKLERFAVLKQHRGKGVGAALVKASLQHAWTKDPGVYVYMHAQEHALEFYSK